MALIGYARVSSVGRSLDVQLDKLQQMLLANRHESDFEGKWAMKSPVLSQLELRRFTP